MISAELWVARTWSEGDSGEWSAGYIVEIPDIPEDTPEDAEDALVELMARAKLLEEWGTRPDDVFHIGLYHWEYMQDEEEEDVQEPADVAG